MVIVNGWILIGARTWSSAFTTATAESARHSTPKKRPEADLLEVYSSAECDDLRSRGILPAQLSVPSSHAGAQNGHCGFEFGETAEFGETRAHADDDETAGGARLPGPPAITADNICIDDI
jgi:hypothetical protein